MIDFEAELNKLLAQESEPLPQDEFVQLAAVGQQLLSALYKKQADISVQVEELYDLAKDSDNTAVQKALQSERAHAGLVIRAAVGLCDLIDDFYEFSLQCGNEDIGGQALMMRKKADGLLMGCGITRLGEVGQPLNPAIHSVQTGAASQIPREHVAKVLQSGYLYLGAILRKATVVVSMGPLAQAEPVAEAEPVVETEPVAEAEPVAEPVAEAEPVA